MSAKQLGFRINGKGFSLHEIGVLKASKFGSLWQETLAFLDDWFAPDDTIMQQSSGSTGAPKRIALTKASLEASAKMTGEFFGFDSSKTLFLCLSPTFIAGKMMIIRALVWKMNLIVGDTSANPVTEVDQQIDFSAMVPLQLSKIVEETPEKLKFFKTIILGGSAVSKHLEQNLQQFDTHFYHTYGMTETMSHIALRKINGADKSDWFAHLNGVELSADERNCLQITAERLGINKLTTNDIVVINEDEEFKVLGRIDDVIISAGVKIHPLLIEQKLQKHIFSPLLLLGKKDEIAGEIVVLVIEGEFSIKAIYQLWQTLSAVLPANEIPRRLYFVDQIPLLPSGKPDRRGLKARV